jgi:hypothetical protein
MTSLRSWQSRGNALIDSSRRGPTFAPGNQVPFWSRLFGVLSRKRSQTDATRPLGSRKAEKPARGADFVFMRFQKESRILKWLRG